MELREPERVPIAELRIDPPHIETLMFPERFWSPEDRPAEERKQLLKHNAEVQVKCLDRLGFSLAWTRLTPPTGWSAHVLSEEEAKNLREETGLSSTAGTFIDEWGRGTVYDPNGQVWVQQYGTITSIEKWEEWAEIFPDPWAEGRDEDVKILAGLATEHDLISAGRVRAPFGSLFEAFPIATYYRLQLEHPDFIRKAVKAYTDYNCEAIKRYGESGCDLTISGGDLAHRDGPHMKPELYNEFFAKEMRREVEAAHKAGIKYVKHTDGDIRTLIPGLVNISRVDGLHSLDPSAGVDIGKVKEEWGDKIFLMGNVAVDSLALKSTQEVVEETKDCIRKAAPGGGFVLGSSNTWYAHCKLANCLAMTRTGHEYGKYPIKLP
jgi:uroporphyrinogen decarboxylase